ncbi:MAG: glycosyltransferase family 1 protein [Chitinophagales bacterium]
MRILIATDAWTPLVNGVVRTYQTVTKILKEKGDEIYFVTPENSPTIPFPLYPEIKLTLFARNKVEAAIDKFQPDAIHIGTEGPIGLATRQICLQRQLPFTTSYHTRFPVYLRQYLHIPLSWSYPCYRRFHAHSSHVLVPSESMKEELDNRKFENVKVWSRGVDLEVFKPIKSEVYEGLQKPILLYVGRVSYEKNIEAFLSLSNVGTKVVVGDGPRLAKLQRKYTNVVFVGYQNGDKLAAYYANADVCVFPSLTDTFGLVLLEALACGTPVAAFPVTGPKDVIGDASVGALDIDLSKAVEKALQVNRENCLPYAKQFTWENCALHFRQFLAKFTEDKEVKGLPYQDVETIERISVSQDV